MYIQNSIDIPTTVSPKIGEIIINGGTNKDIIIIES